MLCPLKFGHYEFEGGQGCIGIECGMHKLCNANDAPPEGTFQVSHDYGSTFSPPVKIQGEQDSSDSRIRKGLGYKDVPPHEPSEATKRFIEELDSELDSSEKLEADALALVDNLRVYGCNYAGDAEVEIIGMLDRQAAITEREYFETKCHDCQDAHDRQTYKNIERYAKLKEKVDALEAENAELRERVDNLCASEEIGNKLIAQLLDSDRENNRRIVEYAEKVGELEAELNRTCSLAYDGEKADDTREKLEEDVSSFNPLRGLRELANTSKHHTNAEWKKNLLRMVNNADDYIYRFITESLDRQAAITERECLERAAKSDWLGQHLHAVMAENRELQAKLDELTAENAELSSELAAARNAHAQAEHDAETYREKLGRMLDNAHEIERIGQI